MKQCSSCKLHKEESEFNKNKSKKDGLQAYCKACHKKCSTYQLNRDTRLEWQRNRRSITRQLMWNYLKMHPCVDCGETDPVVLQFDHFRDKKYQVANLVSSNMSWQNILKEIEKCEIRCANCHYRKTAREKNYYKTVVR